MGSQITIRGARQHNLKNVTVSLPRDAMTVVTGPSGSGKSSLVFDTLFAEGQRRYVESLSGHARRLLARYAKPDVDLIEGLSPTIAVSHRAPVRNPRATVGTLSEVHDYLRVLFSALGQPHCPECGEALFRHTAMDVVNAVQQWPEGTKFEVLAPVRRPGQGKAAVGPLIDDLQRQGFVRVRLDGAAAELADVRSETRASTIDVVIDRLSVREQITQRLVEAVELGWSVADGFVVLRSAAGDHEQRFSSDYACFSGHARIPALTAELFSFSHPTGACPKCEGVGAVRAYVEHLAVPDGTRSLRDGAVVAWGSPDLSSHQALLKKVASVGVSLDVPWNELSAKDRERVLRGADGFDGVFGMLERRAHEYERRKRGEGALVADVLDFLAGEFARYAELSPCPTCEGRRLCREALAVRLGDDNIASVTESTVPEIASWTAALAVPEEHERALRPVVQAIEDRLSFLEAVGLDYLTLDRRASSLSTGETQRVRLATQLGGRLSGVLYVLDEPTSGLHPHDIDRLLDTIQGLLEGPNTVVVVEHDELAMRRADHLVDMGPGAGAHGGDVVAQGTVDAVVASKDSPTGAFLSGARSIGVPDRRRTSDQKLTIEGADQHNLQSVTVDIPLRTLCCITGVSGSGKSSLVTGALVPALKTRLQRRETSGVDLRGWESIQRVLAVDAEPIGTSAKSSPATYLGLMTPLRELFAGVPEARARGYKPGRFSFNVKGGRCEACKGEGTQRVQMLLLPDALVTCEVCQGARYNLQTLEVKYRGLSIADVLGCTVDDAIPIFEAVVPIRERLEALRRVGLGYLQLGRSAPTLSSGEAQRVKLARDLAKKRSEHNLYVFDEPTRGLHFVDIEQLVSVFHQLVDQGHSVIVVEHQLDVVKNADHVIDLGPGAGASGGRVVVAGTPEEVAACKESVTGRYLRQALA